MNEKNDRKGRDVPGDESAYSRSDAFWSLDKIMPKTVRPRSFSFDTDPVDIESDCPADGAAGSDRTKSRAEKEDTAIPPQRTAVRETPGKSEPELTYEPSPVMLRSVTVWRWPSKYTFYERFRTDAEKHFSVRGQSCDWVPFFSYMPQYIQLDAQQRAYYFWWRENARQGRYLRTDYSYLMLYIYEIINLPDRIAPEEGLEQLCGLWLAYRDKFPKLDRYLSEWVCDYCLIYRLPAPYETLAGILGDVVRVCSFREFYLGGPTDGASPLAVTLIGYASNYNYRKSRLYQSEYRSLYEKHIYGAMDYVLSHLPEGDSLADVKMQTARISRDTFVGSLCAYDIKRRLDIEYYSCSRSHEVREVVTGVVKAAENQIRAMCGISARFSLKTVGDTVKSLVAAYFEPFRAQAAAARDEPEYMRMYEPEKHDFSEDEALAIEERSWGMTGRLVEALMDDAESGEPGVLSGSYGEQAGDGSVPPSPAADSSLGDISVPAGGTSPELQPGTPRKAIPEGMPELQHASMETREQESSRGDMFDTALRMLLDGRTDAFDAYARRLNLLPDSLAEIINETAYDLFGDIIAEAGESGYRLIPDYRTDAEEYLNGK